MNKLDEYRHEIDLIDKTIIKLIEQRFEIVEKVGKYKEENQIPIYDKSRETLIYNKIDNIAQPKYNEPIKDIYYEIITKSKDVQRKE